jgi:hypothetical protein
MSSGQVGVGAVGVGMELLEARRLLAFAPEVGVSFGGVYDDSVVDMARDALPGHVYVVGMFRGKIDVDPRAESSMILSAPTGGEYDAAGSRVRGEVHVCGGAGVGRAADAGGCGLDVEWRSAGAES